MPSGCLFYGVVVTRPVLKVKWQDCKDCNDQIYAKYMQEVGSSSCLIKRQLDKMDCLTQWRQFLALSGRWLRLGGRCLSCLLWLAIWWHYSNDTEELHPHMQKLILFWWHWYSGMYTSSLTSTKLEDMFGSRKRQSVFHGSTVERAPHELWYTNKSTRQYWWGVFRSLGLVR